jgi:soluble lytic murein transglycosylase-like protein
MTDDAFTMKESCLGRTLFGLVGDVGRHAAAGAGLAIAIVFCLAQSAAAETETSSSTRFVAVEAAEPGAEATTKPTEPADAAKEPGSSDSTPPLTSQTTAPDARTRYRTLIEKEAAGTGLAPEIAEAVMGVESGYNPDVIGGAGEIGLMQILPSTARMLGFSGPPATLGVPETNVHYGAMYLAQAWRLAGGDLCTAVMKYRAGHGETRFSYLSVNYCVAVRARLAARGFRVTGIVPVATFGEPGRSGGAGCGRRCLGGGGRIGRVDLAALNTRLSALVVQVHAGR